MNRYGRKFGHIDVDPQNQKNWLSIAEFKDCYVKIVLNCQSKSMVVGDSDVDEHRLLMKIWNTLRQQL